MANNNKKGGNAQQTDAREQLKATKELSAVMAAVAASAINLETRFRTQAEITKQIAENMKESSTGEVVTQLVEVNKTLKEVSESLKQMQQSGVIALNAVAAAAAGAATSTNAQAAATEKAAKASQQALTPQQRLAKTIKNTSNNLKGFKQQLKAVAEYLEDEYPAAVGAAVGAMSGFMATIKATISIGSGIFSFLGTLASSLWEIGKSILMIPFKLFDGLVGMAKKHAGTISEFAQAINNLRDAFGHLSGEVASTIINVSHSMKGFEGAGISAFQVFGNVAERQELLIKLFQEGGVVLQNFTKEFKTAGGALLGYQRGLGLSAKQLSAFAHRAKVSGKGVNTVLNSVTKQALHLGKTFQIDAKIIARSMADAASDVGHFGRMSTAQLGKAVVYANKLGLELSDIAGTLDAFSNFDDASKNVSRLNSVFGTTIDTMKLLSAEDPTEIISHLREEFKRAGVDGNQLNRHYKRIIEQSANLTSAQVDLIFSQKNQGVEMKKVAAESTKAEKAALSQAQAMNKLADAMKRTLKAGQFAEGGFFDHFFKGFTDGIQRTAEFRQLLRNIARSLMDVYREGRRLGAAFVEYFPGVKDFINALADIFSPGKFKQLAGGVTDILIQFFKDLNDPNGKASFSGLMAKLKEHFFDFFNKQTGPGSKLLSSFGQIMDAIKVIIAGGVSWVMITLAEMVRTISAVIRDPSSVQGAGALGDAAQAYVSPIAQAFREGWTQLGPALNDLFTVMFEKLGSIIGPMMEEWANEHWMDIALIMFGPMAASALLGALVGMLGNVLVVGIKKAFGLKGPQDEIAEGIKKINEQLSNGGPGGRNINVFPKYSQQDIKSFKNMEIKVGWNKVMQFIVGFAAFLAIGLGAFALALEIAKGAKKEELIAAGGVIVTIAVVSVIAAKALQMIDKIKVDNDVLTKMGMLALAIEGMAGLAWLIFKTIGGIDLAAFTSAAAIVTETGALIVAGAYATVALGKAADIIKKSGISIKDVAIAGGAGIAVIGVAVAAAIGLAWEVVSITNMTGIKEPDMEKAKKMMGLALKIIGVGAAATLAMLGAGAPVAIGAAIGSTFGPVGALIGGAIAAAAQGAVMYTGYKIIAEVVNRMVELAKGLAESAKSLPSDMMPKAEALVKILEALVKIAEVIPNTLNSMNFGILDNILGRDVTKIEKVVELTKVMFSGPSGDGKGGLIGLVSIVTDAVKQIGVSDATLKAAASLASVLSAVAEIAKSMTLSGEFSGALTAAAESWTESQTGLISSLGNYAARMNAILFGGTDPSTGVQYNGAINELMKIVNDPLTKSITENEAKAVTAIAGLLSAVAGIGQALIIPDGMSKVLTAVASTYGENTQSTLPLFTQHVEKTAAAISLYIIPALKGPIATILSGLHGINFTEHHAKTLGVVAPLLKVLMDFAGKITQMVSEQVTKIDPKDVSTFLNDLKLIGPLIGNIFDEMSVAFKKLIPSINQAINLMPSDDSYTKKVEALAKAFEGISSIINFVKIFNSEKEKDKNVPSALARPPSPEDFKNDFQLPLQSAIIFFDSLLGEGSKFSFKDLMDRVNNFVKKFGNISTNTSSGIEKISTIFNSMKSIIDSIASIKTSNLFALPSSGDVPDAITKPFDPIGDVLNNVIYTLESIFIGNETIRSKIKMSPMAYISQLVSKSAQLNIKGFTPMLTDISAVFSGLLPVLTALNNFGGATIDGNIAKLVSDNITRVISSLNNLDVLSAPTTLNSITSLSKFNSHVKSHIKEGYGQIIKDVQEMMSAIVDIDNALQKGTKIDLQATFDKFTSTFAAGTGKTKKIDITTKPIHIEATFTALIDATKLEGAILQGDSQLKKKINIILKGAKKLKEVEASHDPNGAPDIRSAKELYVMSQTSEIQ